MAKKKIKKAVKKVLDKTELDEKIVDVYEHAKEIGLIDKVKCYIKCYGGYVLALGAGCTFGVSFWWGLGLTVAAGAWAYWQVCKCKACIVNSNSCCK